MKTFSFNDLEHAELIVDALYQGGAMGHAGDDPLAILMGAGNQGGFRFAGQIDDNIKLCVLYSTMIEPDWPDVLDHESGLFIYYGDNRTPGKMLHETSKKGNEILRITFDALHTNHRHDIPPFFVFTKGPCGRDVIFRGLAVPGAKGIQAMDDLMAVWRTTKGQRFQNYKATFTILDIPQIPRAWLDDIHAGKPHTTNTPTVWKSWIHNGSYKPLCSSIRHIRTKQEQLPSIKKDIALLHCLVNYFKKHPKKEYAFEGCAAEIARMMDPNIIEYDLTRPWRDNGRDAIGTYRIGTADSSISVVFALEAKCYKSSNGSGVNDTSRLISRLRHRQFGIFVTTSYVSSQAYNEIWEDKHPVIILSGMDIIKVLRVHGHNTDIKLTCWLKANFPYTQSTK